MLQRHRAMPLVKSPLPIQILPEPPVASQLTDNHSELLTVHARNLALPATQLATHVLVLARADLKLHATPSKVIDTAAFLPALC
jgi:hypothetical protein